MNTQRIISVSAREIKYGKILEQRMRGEITQKQAALKSRLSIRQVRRKEKRYAQEGLTGIVHQNRGRVSKNRYHPKTRMRIVSLLRSTRYEGFGATLASQMLLEHENIAITSHTLRRIMIEENIPYARRRRKRYRTWRPPKDYYGQMVQLDGSEHDWFEGRGPRCTLLTFIDDSTSEIVWAAFVESESNHSIMQGTYNYFKSSGMPLALYTDRGKCFKVNIHNEENLFLTQYEQGLRRLGVELIHARSPQAKGRVERSFRTAQDRLVKMTRLRNISTKEEANRFLREYYIPRHNKAFARSPAYPGDLHRQSPSVNFMRRLLQPMSALSEMIGRSFVTRSFTSLQRTNPLL